jgi:hypothetical protein
LLDPRNEWLWDVYNSLVTQSRVAGLGGFSGFDYSALPFILKAKGVPESLWAQVLETIEMLTPLALKYWNRKDE